MIRLPTIPVALAALAVTAAPASAGLLSSPLGVSASASVISGKQLTAKAKIIDGRFQIAPWR
jgi:hypothetical protein